MAKTPESKSVANVPSVESLHEAQQALLKFARFLARQAAREDHQRELERASYRKKPRKRILKPRIKRA